MNFTESKMQGLFLIKSKVYRDNRGYFLESYKDNLFKKKIGDISFIQDNESKSCKNTLRGLHFQKPPFSQIKLVRCIVGEILDVVVDLRQDSKTFQLHEKFFLSEKNKNQLFIPKGFAHGFLVLSDFAIVQYKVDQLYNSSSDFGIRWNDPKLSIDWEIDQSKIIISKKDSELGFLADSSCLF